MRISATFLFPVEVLVTDSEMQTPIISCSSLIVLLWLRLDFRETDRRRQTNDCTSHQTVLLFQAGRLNDIRVPSDSLW